MTPLKHTPLHAAHLEAGARMTAFAGWDMPLHYGSQLDEHHTVRNEAGMFDVSHMLVLDLSGATATPFLQTLLANDVIRLETAGKALYSCMLNERGGIVDDLIVYRISHGEYRLVVNAATADSDTAWIRKCIAMSGTAVTLDGRRDLAIIAVQGPQAIARAAQAIPELNTSRGLPEPFFGVRLGDLYVGRTGYTGEDGLEIMVPATRAPALWQALHDAGVKPCGLGARDTLRLEAGLNLHGQDMDANTLPWDCGLGWTVDMRDDEREFVGRSALERQPPSHAFLGLVLLDKGVLRAHMRVFTPTGEGETTSGGFSPTLEQSIAFARLPCDTLPGTEVAVEVRGKRLRARTVKLPFVRKGRILI